MKTHAQPFVDVVNFSFQTFNADYLIDNNHYHYTALPPKWRNHTDNFFLNLFLPKEFKNGNTLLIRVNSEMINSTIDVPAYNSPVLPSSYPAYSYTKQLQAVSMPLGFQFVSKNKKWKTVAMVIPKLAGDFKDNDLMKYAQLGGIFLENYLPNDKVKIKAGLYYNREAFGNFFMPLVGVDWKINKRIYLYGILPTNYRAEFNIIKNRLYTGINFKSLTRSFQLADLSIPQINRTEKKANTYVRYDEMQLKLFVDCFVYKGILLYGEVGYSLGKNPLQYLDYNYSTWEPNYADPVYTRTEQYMIFNVGIAYRIRQDLEKKKTEDTKSTRDL